MYRNIIIHQQANTNILFQKLNFPILDTMYFISIATSFAIAVDMGAAFAPSSSFQNHHHRVEITTRTMKIHSSVEVLVEGPIESALEIVAVEEEKEEYVGPLTAELINSRLEQQLEKMRLKDQTSKQLTKEVRFTIFLFIISVCMHHVEIQLVCLDDDFFLQIYFLGAIISLIFHFLM